MISFLEGHLPVLDILHKRISDEFLVLVALATRRVGTCMSTLSMLTIGLVAIELRCVLLLAQVLDLNININETLIKF